MTEDPAHSVLHLVKGPSTSAHTNWCSFLRHPRVASRNCVILRRVKTRTSDCDPKALVLHFGGSLTCIAISSSSNLPQPRAVLLLLEVPRDL